MDTNQTFNPDDEAFRFFLHNIILGDYAESYIAGWDDCLTSLGRNKHNPYSKKVYPLEHRAYNHGFEDGITLLTEFDKHWRGSKRL